MRLKNILIIAIAILWTSCKKEQMPVLKNLYGKEMMPQTIVVVLLKNNPGEDAFVFGTDYKTGYIGTKRVFDVFDDALYFAHHQLLTGDTTQSYLFPFTKYDSTGAILYAYPDIALQYSANYYNPNYQRGFLSWLNYRVNRWMQGHECIGCGGIVISPESSEYFTKITCTIN